MEDPLATCTLLQALPASVRQTLGSACQFQRFRKGQPIFEEGEPVEAVWLVLRGCVYLVKRTPQGEVATVFVMTPEESLCGISAVGYPAYSVGAVAATDVDLLHIPRITFLRLVATYPKFAAAVLLSCCTRIRHMADAISVGHAPVEQRMAYALLRLKNTFGTTIPITHHELARMAGTRWETSIRTLAAWRRAGWLSSQRGRITLRVPRKLRLLLHSTNHHPRHRRVRQG